MEFLKQQQKSMETLGFWTEQYRQSTLIALEMQYKTEIIKEWYITDCIFNGDKTLIKWQKRFKPLTVDELKKKYGR